MPNEKEISGRKVLDRLNRNAGRCALLPLAPPGVPAPLAACPPTPGHEFPEGSCLSSSVSPELSQFFVLKPELSSTG